MAGETEVIADAGSGDSPTTSGTPGNEAVDTPASEPVVDTTAGEPATDDGETLPAADAGKRPEPSVDDLKTTLRAVAKERDAYKKQAKEAEARYEAPTAPPAAIGKQDAGAVDPLLKGKPYDPEDETVEYAPGRWFAKEQAISMAKADYLYAQTQQAGQAQQAARLADDRNDIYESVGKSVTETVKKAFPNLSDQARVVLDKIVDDSFMEMMRENRIPLDFDPTDLSPDFPDLVKAAQVRGLERATLAVIEFQNPQKAKQAEAGVLQPVSPGGTPAAPAPKKYGDMSDEEQHKDKLSIADRILRRHGVKSA